MKGRPSKPTSLKVLQGNAGHRKIDDGVEPAPPEGAIAPPGYLSAAAKAKWFEVVAVMQQVPGWLTLMDSHVLACFCSATALFEEAERRLPELKIDHARERNAKKKARLWGEICALVGQRRNAMKDMKAFGTEFGWSSVSRTRVRLPSGQGEFALTAPTGPAPTTETAFEKTQRLAKQA